MLQERQHTFHQLADMFFEDLLEFFDIFCELPQIRHVHLNEIDELEPHKARLALESHYDGLDQLGFFEDLNAFLYRLLLLVGFVSLDVALVEDEIKQVQDVILHGQVPFFNDIVEGLYQWFQNAMSKLVRKDLVLFDVLENQLEEFAG